MWLGKRFFDLFFSMIGLVVFSPLFILMAFWIKWDSVGPIFYRQVRVGKNLKEFRIHKFRSMKIDSDKSGLLTVGQDERVTKSGRFIRKYKLDELAQLIDVFIGEMSLVGPRPEVPKYVAFYPQEIKDKIFQLRPGITDWASILYRDENDLLQNSKDPEKTYIDKVLPDKLNYCLKYYDESSFVTDLKIIVKTIMVIF